ncbi:LysR family transcriptional regulator [Glaciecola siphonariae]|uniref:LysR family transcriptional regulator n=1 Tax=Glaciecola siphonariae TaxID=521012 RepID=A0ABV9LRU5_9ALTE
MSVSYKNMCAFVSVAQSNTFAEAAEKLCLSQPALSTSIKNMETQLGGPLFIRSTRRVTLTPEGEVFLPVAKRLINDWDSALNDVKDLFSIQKGRLAVASMPSFAEGHLAHLLQHYHETYPKITLRVLDVVMERVIDAVQTGRADIGFVFEPESLQGLSFAPLLEDSFCAVMPAQHELVGLSAISLSDIKPYPLVAMNTGSSIRLWVDKAFNQANITQEIVAEASQLGTLGQLVKTGLGLAIVPQLCKQQMLNKSLRCVPLKDSGLKKRVGMIARSPGALSNAGQSLWQMALKTVKDVK